MPGRLAPWTPSAELSELRDQLDRACQQRKHEERKEHKGKTYLRRERGYGSFTRSMALPEGVDPSKIKAKTKDGVVEVTIPLPSQAKNEPVTITPTAA